MNPRISVVIPAFNAEVFIADAVRAVLSQPIPREQFECIVCDDASPDQTWELAAQAGAPVERLKTNSGPSAARNAGIKRARGEWIAFTDADCVPSRRWLPSLLAAIESSDRSVLGFAGKTIGLQSQTPAAKFMDLIGALDSENYLKSEVLSWSPGCNLAYRREDLLAVNGLNEKLRAYEVPDLHLRITERFGGQLRHVPTAVVMHRHRPTWRKLWRQQLNYGRGYAIFLLLYSERWPWSLPREAGAWGKLVKMTGKAVMGQGENGLVQRGLLIKHLAQRLGFVSNYFSPRQRKFVAAMKCPP